MTVWIAIILGLVQGLCEFLPVSSSGHLFILENAFGIQDGGTFFTIMLHIGTLIAVFIAYWNQIVDIIRHPFQRKTGMLLISTVATVAMYLIFNKLFDEALSSGMLLGYSFLLTAVLLFIVDIFPQKNVKSIQEMRIPSALGIGLMQGIGILPGVSRSGATISGALFFNLERSAAAEYSFLLSIPAIVGGFATEIPDMVRTGFSGINWLPVIVGTLVAAVSGYLAIRFMIRLITKKKLYGFAIYVALLGTWVILDQNFLHMIFK